MSVTKTRLALPPALATGAGRKEVGFLCHRNAVYVEYGAEEPLSLRMWEIRAGNAGEVIARKKKR